MLPPLFDLFTCKSKKHTARAVDFKFFLVFQICFFVLSFSAVFDLPLSAACFCFLFFCSDGRWLWVSSSPLFLVVDPAVAKGERRCCWRKLRVDGDEKIGLGLSDVGCWVGLHFCWLQRRMALLLLSASGGAAVKMEGLPWLLGFWLLNPQRGRLLRVVCAAERGGGFFGW